MKTRNSLLAVVTAAAVLLTVTPASGGGFAIFEQGAKAMGMAGAFTAQADDPSALFHNVGGLAFFEEREISAGITLITSTDEEFIGLPPGIAQGQTGTLTSLQEPLPHFYWVQPVNRSWNFGLAINSPFGLKTDWENPDDFIGRFINTKAALLVVDLNPNLGVKLTENFGIGLGAIIRLSEVELNQRLPVFNPLTGTVVDGGSTNLQSDMTEGFGWQVGMLHRYNDSFSWGFSYRSTVTSDFQGDARFTQISTGFPPLDALLAATIPFDTNLPVKTSIEFPDSASFGVAFALGAESLLEMDVNWTGWSSFDSLLVEFTNAPVFSFNRPENWDDSMHYRLGLLFGRDSGREWRFGYVMDESPQPDASVSPLLPDSDRAGYTVGWGREGDGVDIDLALMYLDFDKRTISNSNDGFNGSYSQTGWLLAATLGF